MLTVQCAAARAVAAVLGGASLTATLAGTVLCDADLTRQQRGAIQDIAFGTLRWLGPLRFALDRLATRGVADPVLRALLLCALYQLSHSRSAPHAIVDHAVRAAGALTGKGMTGFVNAVLRNYQRQRPAIDAASRHDPEARYSHPRWWIERLQAQYPDDFGAILDAGNGKPPMTLRVNVRLTTCDAYAALLDAAGIVATKTGPAALTLARAIPVADLPGFDAGLVSVQDAAAQWAAPLLDVRDGQRVLDACAAPGGKTAHLLECASLDLVAVEADATRARRISANLDRLGLRAHTAIVVGDAGHPPGWWDGRPFDRILLDAPCTASGVVRRHPDAKWLRRASDVGALAAQQAVLLDALWRTLAAGGKLLYATCSVFAPENGGQSAAFLGRHGDARSLPVAVPDSGDPGETGSGTTGKQWLPDTHHDGFFYALFQKC